MEYNFPKSVSEKITEVETEAEILDSKKWYRSVWFRIVRIPLVVSLFLLGVGCCTIQPSGADELNVKLRANPEVLKQETKEFTTEIKTRYYQEKEDMQKVRAYIRKKFAAAGAMVEEQEYALSNSGVPQYNVRGFYGDPKKPRIVVGAHYDTCMAHDAGINAGADDNASGVVGLFGLARLLQKQPPQNVCVELVAYSTEEPPYFGTDDMGSYRHAELLRKQNVEVKGVLILEMIGYFSDEPKSQKYPSLLLKALYPSTGNFIAVVGGFKDRPLIKSAKRAMRGAAPLKVISSCIPRNMEMVHLSDHRNYWKFDYDAAMITDTSFYRNPHYHMSTDTWDTLDYERMAHVVTQTHQAVLALAKEVDE